ncbi:LOW QUALITY PROTEIN: uncharacterized protein LOC110176696 [Drosophila serrata]|uniref:LOW QUALITY PROTEIN: uncharacterized protein LOC110176696 n=1 Tax=Drosophila serrata TaxID=7274 RepID=UPI000A1D0455|nr:LOW QUALITY PROTEIN: uncharacterized protein LOC110176696 [Drosophila serrata]
MYQPWSPGPSALFVIVVLSTASATVSNVEPFRVQEKKTLQQDYVNGILNLKSSMLTKRPDIPNSNDHSEEHGRSHNKQGAAADTIGSRGEYMRQLQDQSLEQKKPKIQVDKNVNLRHSWQADRPLDLSQMQSLPSSAGLVSFKKDLQDPQFVQSPFSLYPMLKKSKTPVQQPTAQQLQMLQHLSEFFEQRHKMQRPGVKPAAKATKTDQSENQDECDSEATTVSAPKTTKEPETCEGEESVTVIIKPEGTTKTTAAPETSTSTNPTKYTKAPTKSTTKHTKSTTKRLPCCTKPKSPRVVEPFTVGKITEKVQNNHKESDSLMQQPRSHRNVFHPELMVKAFGDLLKYNEFIANSDYNDQGQQKRRRVKSGRAKKADREPTTANAGKE